MEFEKECLLFDNYSHIDSSLIYSPTSVPGRGANLLELESQLMGCKCSRYDTCLNSSPCQGIHICKQNYTFDKLLYDEKWSCGGIVECNSQCTCPMEKCTNRVAQFGPRKNLEVFITGDNKGYGLKSQELIPKGAFICEYAGELIGLDEAKERFKAASSSGRMNYIFVLREMINSVEQTNVIETIVDPSIIGNIGRYINHSCDSNSGIIPVRVDSPIPKLGIFAKYNIAPGQEITFDYSGDCMITASYKETDYDKKPCYCSAKTCRGFLPYDDSLL